MKQNITMSQILELTDSLEITIKKVSGVDSYGFCIVNGKKYILVEKKHSESQIIRDIAEGLCTLDLDRIYMKPFLRDYLEEVKNYLDK